jgi:hypothetical protein
MDFDLSFRKDRDRGGRCHKRWTPALHAARALLRSGDATESKRAFDALGKLLGLDKAADNSRC